MTPDQSTTDDMVAESALQLWSAAQTDFDPFEVDDVRDSLERLDGVKVVVGREAGTCSVLRVIPEDTPL